MFIYKHRVNMPMASVASTTERLVKEKPSLEYALKIGVVSYVRLARFLKDEIEHEMGSECSLASIVMALTRMESGAHAATKGQKYNIKNISTRSGMADITIARSMRVKELVGKVQDVMEAERGESANFVHGNNELTMIFSSSKFKEVKAILRGEKIREEVDGLSQLSISFDEKMADTPGLIALILKELAWRGINVVEVVSTYTELGIILHEEDIVDAYKAVRELFKEKK
ncbi:Uncharacterised protein [Candidatus Anstonella stagnisolia]|nr:Uncharacterised protein [Candidatus Anstonella stagnisolia]